MPLRITPVATRRDIREFVRLPFAVYRRGPEIYDAWVPPLNMDVRRIFDPKRNSLYDHSDMQGFLARDGDRVVGRAVAIVDRNYCAYQNTQTGFWGYYESFDRPDAAQALLGTCEDWVKERGMRRIIGPVHGSTGNQMGNLIDAFDLMPVIDMPYAPPYYAALFENAGYGKEKDLYSYRQEIGHMLSEKILRVAAIAEERNRVEIRTVDMKRWDEELDNARQIYDDAWADNWGYVPWHKPDFAALAQDLKLAVNPEFTYVASIDGETAGFMIPIPDLNPGFHKAGGRLLPFGIFHLLAAKKNASMLRVAAMGVRKKFQNRGIDAIFIARLDRDASSFGFTLGDMSWILEDNVPLRNLLDKWGAEHYRTHRVYGKDLA